MTKTESKVLIGEIEAFIQDRIDAGWSKQDIFDSMELIIHNNDTWKGEHHAGSGNLFI